MKLSDYLKKGYIVIRGAIPDLKPDHKYHIPLRDSKTLQTYLYPTNSEAEAASANSEWENNKNSPAGFRQVIIFSVRGFHDFEYQQFNFTDVTEFLVEQGYRLEIKDGQNFELALGEVHTLKSVQGHFEKIEEQLLKLSISYKLGFEVVAQGIGEFYNFQPFNFGPAQTVSKRLDRAQFKEIPLKKLTKNQLDFLQTLKTFYSQTNLRAKTIVGWAILEDYFYNGRPQIGDKGKEWKTVQHYAEQSGILNFNFKNLYAFRCAKAHEFKDKPEAIEAVKQMEDIFELMKGNILIE